MATDKGEEEPEPREDEGSSSAEDYEDIQCEPIYVGAVRGQPNAARIEQMARPKRRRILALFEEYACRFPPEKMLRIKKMVEESFCMSPEQTEKYFQELREENERRKLLRKQRRKEHLRHKKLKIQERKARVRLKIICILRDCMLKAYNTPMKILMSERLRQVSDVVLCQLCDILNRNVPDRDCQDKVSRVLISFADWIAYWIETIAYDIEADRVVAEVPSTVKGVTYVQSRTQTENEYPPP